ncbi:hypothetical protein FEM08_34260 [Flavobacterium gilvum]|nr:hypothetical protein FEM08_34260 [Flavobacterium gilvum]
MYFLPLIAYGIFTGTKKSTNPSYEENINDLISKMTLAERVFKDSQGAGII